MKKILLWFMPSLFILLTVSIGSGHNNSAPSLDCAICHQGDFAPELVSLEGLPETYTPGKRYKLSISVNSDLKSMGDIAGGFALESSAGDILVTDGKNTQLINSILTHTQDGSELRKWNFAWKAPLEKVDVTFTIMAVAANGDFSSTGDIVSAGSFTTKAKK
ncbi:MAG: choice-of-anchor V domain-containing protein [Nitrospirota bacterium]